MDGLTDEPTDGRGYSDAGTHKKKEPNKKAMVLAFHYLIENQNIRAQCQQDIIKMVLKS